MNTYVSYVVGGYRVANDGKMRWLRGDDEVGGMFYWDLGIVTDLNGDTPFDAYEFETPEDARKAIKGVSPWFFSPENTRAIDSNTLKVYKRVETVTYTLTED